jgi:hypothetical protein
MEGRPAEVTPAYGAPVAQSADLNSIPLNPEMDPGPLDPRPLDPRPIDLGPFLEPALPPEAMAGGVRRGFGRAWCWVEQAAPVWRIP